MPKFESPIKVSAIESLTGNSTLLHLGKDNRVGIGTDAPETKLHVNGAITATGLIVPASVLSTQGDSAQVLGFNPNMDVWYTNTDGQQVVNGWIQTSGDGSAAQSEDRQLGLYSAEFDNDEAIWKREVVFDSPLYANIFLQGTMSYKFDAYNTETPGMAPGMAVTLTHRAKADSGTSGVDSDGNIIWSTQSTNTFIVPVASTSHDTNGLGKWTTAAWRAHTPGNREITKLKIELISSSSTYYPIGDSVHNDGGAGDSSSLGNGVDYNWNLDGFSLQFMHPDMRVDQFGRITGAFIETATIEDLHIKDMISSTSAQIYDNTVNFGTDIPVGHPDYPEDGLSDGGLVRGLVANSSYANGWSILKTGAIRATDIEIYAGDGTVLIDANARDGDRYNPFHRWTSRRLSDFDPDASDYLYGLSFEESNRTNASMRVGYIATTGSSENVIQANNESLYIANTSGVLSGSGDQLGNGSINFNGITTNAPPGSIYTGNQPIARNLRDSYILFLANTQKWSTDVGLRSKYHANNYDLGEYGLYVIGKPTVGGWLYQPHANDTWYTIDSVQSGNRLHEKDFYAIGRAGTDGDGKFIQSLTTLNVPKNLDDITNPESTGSFPPIGITAGGILFADIHINRYNHTANNGEIQLINPRNYPNTQFSFIHPGTSDPNDSRVYTANGGYGVLMSLEDFPGSRYITYIGANKTRSQPGGGTGFTFYDNGHSPDFIAAYPIGDRWFYNQDEGRSAEFTPDPRDCIVARVDSNGASMSGDGSSGITNIYLYAQREATTAEGATLSDLIIDPPRGMAHGGIVFATANINHEFNQSDSSFKANNGFIAFSNPENDAPKNSFYVVHPHDRFKFWQTSNVARGVATSLVPTINVYGTRHIAFVGHSAGRFPAIATHENVSNDFIAVSKYNDQGIPRADGKWYYDPGTGISDDYVFDVDANDFVVATVTSYNPATTGIDQLTIWAENEGVVIIDGVATTVSSVRNQLDTRITTTNNYVTTAIDLAQNAYSNAVTAQANVAQALGLLDGSIAVYLRAEGEDLGGGKVFANNDHDATFFDYGDIWINTSTYNQAIDGSWYANAIFRFQNSLSGFADTSDTNGLSWRHDPTNPQGLAYLQGLTARGFADRATVFYYMNKLGSDPYYGPNVATIAVSGPDQLTGRAFLNFNPEGDMWFDTTTGGTEENKPYIYRTNTSFSTSNATNSGYANGIGHMGEWSQTAFSTSAGQFDPSADQTGWYQNRDAAQTTDSGARADATAALTAAANSQYSADREINAFFEAHNVADVPDATGNGDIWIHTDTAIDSTGTKNAHAIYISNTKSGGIDSGVNDPNTGYDLFWHPAPNNAIGLMYLESYSAGVGGDFQRTGSNILPRGLSLFDGPASDYKIGEISDAIVRAGIKEAYAIEHALPTGSNSSDISNVAIDHTGNSYIGTSSLRVTMRADGPNLDQYGEAIRFFPAEHRHGTSYPLDLVQNNLPFGIDIPQGKRWIYSYYVKANSAASELYTYPEFYFSNTSNISAGIVAYSGDKRTIPVANQWKREEFILDLTSGTTSPPGGGAQYAMQISDRAQLNVIYPTLYVNASSSAGVDYFFDAFQLEEVPNTVFVASHFKEPSDGRAIVFGREITDGKIVTHYSNNFYSGGTWYGPIPNTTPTGLPNPQPHGDFWVNTGNNNIVFRYHQNDFTTIPTAQTVHWTSETNGDGWYTTEDLRTGNALSTSFEALANAATAQAAADREILAYFETDPPSASGFGDIWIDVDKYATLNTQAIYVANTQASSISAGDFYWHQAPNNAVGQVYLNAYLAERRANRSESLILSVTESADLPFPVEPDANGIFVGATGNLVFYLNSETEYLENQPSSSDTGHITVTNRGGIDLVSPQGKIQYPNSGETSDYGIKTTGVVATGFYASGGNTVTNSTFSSLYLMYSNMNAAARFADGGTVDFGTHNHIIPVQWTDVGGLNTWQAVERDHTTHDFIPDSANGDFLVAALSRPTAVPEGFATLDSWMFKTLPTQTQAIGDGKIVTHFNIEYDSGAFGPKANVTPTGLNNPNPHGDFWINTSNSNLIFRYHQNTDNNWAQTAFHAPIKPEDNADQSGWYSTEDLRIANNQQQATNTYAWLANTVNWAGSIEANTVNNSFWTNLALANAINANTAAYVAQAAADREINAFFVNHDGTIPTATGNGDVWIHVDNAIYNDPNPATGATKNTGAIFVANTLDTGGIAGGSFFWHQSPNNAIGRMYIDAYAAGITYTDGRVVTHYYDSDNQPYGPSPNTTPSGSLNPYPDGDLWVDTGNNNILFRYNQNATINWAQSAYWEATSYVFDPANHKSGWYALEDPRLANSEIQTANLNVWLANTHNWATYLDTESANNQLYVNFALANAFFANGVAYNANAAAYLAQAAADREILAYFQIHSDVPDATGNGDVWIHTDTLIKSDGTLNASAIYAANSHTVGGVRDAGADHRWYSSPNNAIGLMYAKSYASGVGGDFNRGTNLMPRGISLFDSPLSDYNITSADRDPITTVEPFAIHTTSTSTFANVAIDHTSGSNSYIAGSSLRVTTKADSEQWFAFASASEWNHTQEETQLNQPHRIKVPQGKKFIFSFYVKANTTGTTVNPAFFTSNTTHFNSGWIQSTLGGFVRQTITTTDWERHHWTLDLTSGDTQNQGTSAPGVGYTSPRNQVTSVTPLIYVRQNRPENTDFYFDALQLEEVPEAVVTPSQFNAPSENAGLVFGREITDGKIVTHYSNHFISDSTYYGPQPNTTPLGLPNPEPDGDFWVDTGNNQIMFRYNQNNTVNFAQTAYWTTGSDFDRSSGLSGWYVLEDPRTANSELWLGTTETELASVKTTAEDALQQASRAASAADAEIQVFFEPSTNTTMYATGVGGAKSGPATGNGDIWIHIDNVYDADGNQNTGSIFFANLSPDFSTYSTYSWQESPDNAIGRAFLDQFTATGRKNWVPSGYSTWDADVDATGFVFTPNYSIANADYQNSDTPYPVTTRDSWYGFASVNTSFGRVSDGSLQVTVDPYEDGQAAAILNFANVSADWNRAGLNKSKGITAKIPKGKRWIFSYYAYTNSSLATGSSGGHPSISTSLLSYDSANTTANTGTIQLNSIYPENGRWNRYSAVIDFSNTHPGATIDEYTPTTGVSSAFGRRSDGVDITGPPYISTAIKDIDSIHLRLSISGYGNTVWFDGFQLEEAPGAQILSGPFSDPDRRIDSHFARSIADGKIVSHYVDGTTGGSTRYGPRPHRTPSGEINLAPHGDFWIDTGNNNMTYRYNANNSFEFQTRDINDPNGAQTAFWGTVADYNNQVGWYIIRDQKFEADVTDAFANLTYQLTRIVDVEGTADGSLDVYFANEGGNFVNAAFTHPDAQYGDIWINTSDYNKAANGTLSTNAIFRWQNSLTGFMQPNPLDAHQQAWRHAPNNAIGQVYLSAYAAQNAADRRVSTYFMGGFQGAEYEGPQTNTTPQGLYNPNPDGDLWIDTSNGNALYVYHLNPANPGTTSHALGFAQTIFYTYGSTGEEGWYSAENLSIAASARALEIARATGTDRAVEIFANTIAPSASGNGDVWIKTDDIIKADGTANLDAIYVANTTSGGIQENEPSSPSHYWYSTSTSALGRTYLDKLVGETGSNWMPRGLSTFSAEDSEYLLSVNENVVTPIQYPITSGLATSTIALDTTQKYIGSRSLKYTIPAGSASYNQILFSNTNSSGATVASPDAGTFEKYGITIPTGRKWIFSAWVRTDQAIAGFGHQLSAYTWDGSTVRVDKSSAIQLSYFNPDASVGDWVRVWHVLDFRTGTSSSATKIILALQAYRSASVERNAWYDGLQLEEAVGDRVTPSKFQEPSSTSEIDFSRAISDGKTVYFTSNAFHSAGEDHQWGPNPSITPNGLTNPEPYGDKWISISPPYKTYLYFSNATNKTSQTAYHAPVGPVAIAKYANTEWPFGTSNNNSGWYEYRDTGDALTQEGFQVALGQIAIGAASWTDGDPNNILDSGIGLPEDNDSSEPYPTPIVDFGDPTSFGQTREILLNPVPPPDTNLHAHWTFNSMNDDAGVRYIPDVSGRNNHAIVHDFTANQAIFRAHDPAQDAINVSGNHSLYSDGVDDVVGDNNAGGIILGVDGDSNRTTLSDGSKIPLDISDDQPGTSGGFNKQTWTLWFKPSSTFESADRIITRDLSPGWGLIGYGSVDKGTDNDELYARWYTHDNNEYNIGSSDSTNWYGNSVHDSSTTEHGGLKLNTWHFLTFTIDYTGGNEQIWLYREGEGLIYHSSNTISTAPATQNTNFVTSRAIKLLEASESADGTGHATDDDKRASGWLDEVRFYNTILTPRNIRYLYMNPTGRPRQLQPRPGVAVKQNYANFNTGFPSALNIDGDSDFKINSFAYMHGYDVDGNPADVDPYVSVNGNVKYLKRGPLKIHFGGDNSFGNNYLGNTGYIMYSDTVWDDPHYTHESASNVNKKAAPYYVFAQPVGSNTTQVHPWRYHVFNDSFSSDDVNTPIRGWKYFTPDDSQHFVIGEGRFANGEEQTFNTKSLYLKDIDVYQFARQPSVVRESYNFTIRPSDFIDNFGGGADSHFFANNEWWACNMLNGTFIAEASIGNAAINDLSASKIQTGVLEAKVSVGGEAKIVIDGPNSRIVISD